MSEERKRPGVGFWATVLAVLILLYPLSTGPFIGLVSSGIISEPTGEAVVETFYAPLVWATDHLPAVEASLNWYVRLWAADVEQ